MDWKNENDYAYTKTHTIEQWAWEFIRRNRKYIQRWEEEIALFNAGKGSNRVLINRENSLRSRSQRCDTLHNLTDPSKDDFRIFTEKKRMNQDANEWGLLDLFNPNVPSPHPHMFPFTEFYMLYIEDPELIQPINVPYHHTLLAGIKLGKPLKPQFKIIEKYTRDLEKRMQNKIPRTIKKPETALWIKYIRILDAMKENAKAKCIIQGLLYSDTDSQSAAEQYQCQRTQAIEMVDRGYINLVKSIFKYCGH